MTPDELAKARKQHRRTNLPVGRPRVNHERIVFSVTLHSRVQKHLFLRLGGSKWLRMQLDQLRERFI